MRICDYVLYEGRSPSDRRAPSSEDMLQLQCTTTEFSSQVEDLMNNILVLLMTKGQKRQDLK